MRKYLFLTIFVLAFLTTVTAYQKPNITEIQDSFGDTYEIDNEDAFNKAVSDREIRFDQNETIEMCVTEVEHEEGADLEFEASHPYFKLDSRPNFKVEGKCLILNLTEEMYSDTLSLRIEVIDDNPSRTFNNFAVLEYNNTVDPLKNQGGQDGSTEYQYSLIKRSRKNELEQRVSNLESTVQQQKSEIENLENEISDKDEQIESLEQELLELKSGISGTIVSMLS